MPAQIHHPLCAPGIALQPRHSLEVPKVQQPPSAIYVIKNVWGGPISSDTEFDKQRLLGNSGTQGLSLPTLQTSDLISLRCEPLLNTL